MSCGSGASPLPHDLAALALGRQSAAGGLWAFYVVGATAGSYALAHLDLWCLAFPLAGLLAAAAVTPEGRANGRSARRSRRAARHPG